MELLLEYNVDLTFIISHVIYQLTDKSEKNNMVPQ